MLSKPQALTLALCAAALALATSAARAEVTDTRTLKDSVRVPGSGPPTVIVRNVFGFVHVIAGGLGISAIILASAQAFAALKFAGAIYLIWLGVRAFREAGEMPIAATKATGAKRALHVRARRRRDRG